MEPHGIRHEAGVAAAEAALRRTHPDLVASVSWYGAVDLDPGHLTVWVLLAGPEDDLPAWAFPPRAGQPWHLDDSRWSEAQRAHVPDLVEMAAEVRACLEEAGWPDAAGAKVGFDSVDRVQRAGRSYFQ